MAKLVGIRVEVFSFGYGKRLFGFKKGETDYRVSLIPMGGYVKLLGEGMFEPSRAIEPDDMMAKSRWQRLLVMVMGSVMNILLAVVLVAVINGVGVPTPDLSGRKAGHRLDRQGLAGRQRRAPDRRRDRPDQRASGEDLERRRDRGRLPAGQEDPAGHPAGRPGGFRRPPDGVRQPLFLRLRGVPGQGLDPGPDGHGRIRRPRRPGSSRATSSRPSTASRSISISSSRSSSGAPGKSSSSASSAAAGP